MKRLKQRIHDLTEDFSWEYHLQKFIAALYAGQNRQKRIAPSVLPQRRQNRRDIALARKAEKLIEENCGANQSLELLARKLGCISRYLRRVFMEEYHVAPIQYLQTYRLLLAKNLLTDTALPVLEVAMAAGFGSLR